MLVFALLVLLVGGTYFYWRLEQWTLVDALYFCVMTMSTIGYGDLVPTSTLSKLFTIVFSILSIGIFAAVVAKVVEIILIQAKERSEKAAGLIQRGKFSKKNRDG